jgi:hypothetical protein
MVAATLAEITDNESGKVYKCVAKWHKRNYKGQIFGEAYINVSNVEGRKMGDQWTIPTKAKIDENGKYHLPKDFIGTVFENDLAGKQGRINEDSFIFG